MASNRYRPSVSTEGSFVGRRNSVPVLRMTELRSVDDLIYFVNQNGVPVSLNSRFLLAQAMKTSQAPDDISRINSDNFSSREALLNNL
jgi:hypothetical protein